MNTAAKGRHLEHRSRRLLEADGFTVTRSAGSKGTWDLIAMNATELVLVQVKATRPPTPAERARLALAPCPPTVRRLVHVWRHRARAPDVLDVAALDTAPAGRTH